MLIVFFLLLIGLLAFYQWWWRRNWQKNLRVGLEIGPLRIFEGDTFWLTQTLSNQKFLRLPFIKIVLPFPMLFNLVLPDKTTTSINKYEGVFSLSHFQQLVKRSQLQTTRRGIYHFTTVELQAREFFTRQLVSKTYPMNKELIVYPKWLEPQEIAADWETSLGETLTQFSLFEDPMLFRNIREMQPSDSMRTINWKKSAVNETFYANQYEPVAKRQVTIILQLPEGPAYKNEWVAETTISLFVTIVRSCLAQGWELDILSNAVTEDGVQISGKRLNSLDGILADCAAIDRIQTGTSADIFAAISNKNPYVIVCSSEAAPQDFQNLLNSHSLWFNVVTHSSKSDVKHPVTVKEVLVR